MKKVLSLVLVLTLVLGSFSMAFAAETTETKLSDVAGNANEGAIVVANDLGIVTGYPDGTFKPTNAVTRAEFATMMTKALAIPESALKGFKTSSFKDVASDHWAVAYLGYCNSKGIMTGYEDGTARPNQTITVNEAITMICRALGYTNQAKELVGSWPANYISLGQQLKLYDDVEATTLTDRASAAQIVYNALTCALVYIDADGATKVKLEADGVTPVLAITQLGGSVLNAGKGLILGGATETGLATGGYAIDVTEYLGSLVKVFINDDKEVIAVEQLSTILDGTYEDGTFTVDGVEYNADIIKANLAAGTTYNNSGVEVAARAKWVSNGAIAGAYGAFADKTDYTLSVNLSGKKITEVYAVIDWEATDMWQFEADDLDLEKAKLGDWEFEKDNNGDIDTTTFSLVGVSSLSKIAEDNIVEVFLPAGATKIKRVAVGTQTVKGTVDEKVVGENKYYIDGTKYKWVGSGTAPTTGETGTAYLTHGGKIAVWEAEDASAGNYAIVTNLWTDRGSKGEIVTKAALLTKDNKEVTYELTSKTVFAGTALGTVTLANCLTTFPTDTAIVTYKLDSSDKITKFTADNNAGINGQVNKNADGIINATDTATYKYATSIVVFMNDGGDWSVTDVKALRTDGKAIGATWSVLDDGKIVAIAVNKATAIGSDDHFGFINTITTNKDDDYVVRGVLNGKDLNAVADVAVAPHKSVAGLAGLYKIEVDANGVIKTVNETPTHGTDVTQAAYSVGGTDVTVTAIDKKSGYVTVKVTASAVLTKEVEFTLAKDVAVYTYDADDGYALAKGGVDAIKKGKRIDLFQYKDDSVDDGLFDIVVIY